MKFLTLFGGVTCLLQLISAYDIFEGFLKQGKLCFGVKETPTCNKTLAESYKSENPNLGTNEPTTKILLFTPESQDVAEQLHLCGGELPPDSTYDIDADTEIFIHGWLDGVCRSAWMREMKEQLFQRGDYNVILVDWTWGNSFDYFLASQNCKIVGEQVGFVINNIMRQTGVGPDKFHVIGHSFGAIASGFCGRKVKDLRRITGLDPALAPFKYAPPKERLTYRDAKIVDIIHSNGGTCFGIIAGDERQLGHADFYPNGGTIQLSCYSHLLVSLLKGDLAIALGSLFPVFCFHLQSIEYYQVSINPDGCGFIGRESSSYKQFLAESGRPGNQSKAIMGMDYELYHPDDEERRKYYLKTTLSCPYYDDSYLATGESAECIAQKDD